MPFGTAPQEISLLFFFGENANASASFVVLLLQATSRQKK